MPQCSNCGISKARLTQNLCKDCVAKKNAQQLLYNINSNPSFVNAVNNNGNQFSTMYSGNINMSSNDIVNGLNQYCSSILDQSAIGNQNNILSQSNYQQMAANNSQVPSIPPEYPVLDVNKPISEINIGELLQIINIQVTKPLEARIDRVEMKIDQVEKAVNQKITSIEKRVTLIENELDKETKKAEGMTGVVVNMQKALNRIDSVERADKLMVFGLSEEKITTDDGVLDSDEKKVQYILSKIGVTDATPEIVGAFEYQRIGKINNKGRPRVLKVDVVDKNLREAIIKQAPKLKQCGEIWKKVFLNRDTHPVYAKENQRLRKKMNELKRQPNFGHETGRVKITKGQLQVDGNIVDQNFFLE